MRKHIIISIILLTSILHSCGDKAGDGVFSTDKVMFSSYDNSAPVVTLSLTNNLLLELAHSDAILPGSVNLKGDERPIFIAKAEDDESGIFSVVITGEITTEKDIEPGIAQRKTASMLIPNYGNTIPNLSPGTLVDKQRYKVFSTGFQDNISKYYFISYDLSCSASNYRGVTSKTQAIVAVWNKPNNKYVTSATRTSKTTANCKIELYDNTGSPVFGEVFDLTGTRLGNTNSSFPVTVNTPCTTSPIRLAGKFGHPVKDITCSSVVLSFNVTANHYTEKVNITVPQFFTTVSAYP
jgi:hypothetical protein